MIQILFKATPWLGWMIFKKKVAVEGIPCNKNWMNHNISETAPKLNSRNTYKHCYIWNAIFSKSSRGPISTFLEVNVLPYKNFHWSMCVVVHDSLKSLWNFWGGNILKTFGFLQFCAKRPSCQSDDASRADSVPGETLSAAKCIILRYIIRSHSYMNVIYEGLKNEDRALLVNVQRLVWNFHRESSHLLLNLICWLQWYLITC